MDKPLLDLMSFFFLPEKGTIENENDFENILKPHLISNTEEGKKYDIQKVILEVEALKKKHLESLNGNRPYGDLLAIADRFIEHCESLLSKDKKQVNKDNHSANKIKLKGSLQSIGFLFSELINKGYIEAPKRNGNINHSAVSRMILEHFEFIDREEQPKEEDIRQSLFYKNSLSADKQSKFTIPDSKIINTD